MNADEIAKALRTLRCADSCNCLSCPCEQFRSYVTNESCDDGTRLAAADLIESLQARITELEDHLAQKTNEADGMRSNWSKCAENYQQKCRDIAELENQLAESQRRERAAVEDIEKMMRICEKGSCHFCANGDCTESPYCNPKWRGPQEAGKGETK